MIGFEAIAFGLFLLASHTCADVCTGRENGEHRPNIDDCSSFFVCNFGESKLFQCPVGLLYDHSKRACNWESLVNCDRNVFSDTATQIPTTLSHEAGNPTTNSPQTTAPTTISTQSPSHNTDATGPFHPTSDPAYTTNKPVTPVYNGSDVDEIRPDDFSCMDPGFYFAPHPRNCQKYFICENYRIHHYECGEGVYWDYVNTRCTLPRAEICYPKNPTNNFGQMVCSSSGYTVVYKQVECRYVSAATPVTTSPPVVTTSAPVVTTSAPVVTTSPPVVTTSPPVVTTSASVVTDCIFITCPENQTFIPHENDCRKYYICIEGMAIATSCPANTAWDESLTQCNEESWKRCIG